MSDGVLVSRARWSPAARRFALLNVAGGAAVLASYAWGLARLGSGASQAWGGVPDAVRPVYQVSMLLAAAGYFPMTMFFLLGMRAHRERRAEPIALLYAAILACSAAWLPLTCAMIERPSAALWWMIRVDLAIVGIAAVAVLVVLVQRRPRGGSALWTGAVLGSIAFCLQTAVLDAIVWPAFFPITR